MNIYLLGSYQTGFLVIMFLLGLISFLAEEREEGEGGSS